MRVLVAFERSGNVRNAFRAYGHEAWSCDLAEAETHPQWHIRGDAMEAIKHGWDLVIAHPPCTHLAVSGSSHFVGKRWTGAQQEAIELFMAVVTACKLYAKQWAIENPVGIMSTVWRKPDQTIQPWQFGHPESKRTCLWLHKLPKLKATVVWEKPETGHWKNQTASGQNKLGQTPDRAVIRSRTYDGVAWAMADQWGKLNYKAI